jgi:lipocalin-like protein
LSTKVKLRDAVLGAWELVSYTIEDSPSGDTTYPLGPHPVGLIMYTGDGYMSAQLMRPDRPAFDAPEPSGGTQAQNAAAVAGYLAYSGPFQVDESTETLRHEVRVSLLPNWLGTTQVRNSHLEGDTLTLSGTNRYPNGAASTHTLLWKRAAQR